MLVISLHRRPAHPLLTSPPHKCDQHPHAHTPTLVDAVVGSVGEMTYFAVEDITARRISDEDGTVEYAVQWKGFPGGATWEKREQLAENCAEMVQVADQRCMDAVDAQLTRWRDAHWCSSAGDGAARGAPSAPRRKRSRSGTPAPVSGDAGQTEVLSGVLLRPPHRQSNGDACGVPHRAAEEGTVLLLGEVVLAEEAAAALNRSGSHHKKRRLPATGAAVALHTAPALELEKRWRETHGQTLLHSVEAAQSITPFHSSFRLYGEDAAADARRAVAQELERSSRLRIISIAPPSTTRSGAVYGAPVALDALVGERDVEQLHLSVQLESPLLSGTAAELVKPHVEQLVVRYVIPDPAPAPTSNAASAAPVNDLFPASGRVTSMPLSVFRVAFPQLLIDYLLEHSVVLC